VSHGVSLTVSPSLCLTASLSLCLTVSHGVSLTVSHGVSLTVPLSRYGLAGALGLYLLTFAAACNYIFINFSVSHTHLPVSAASDYLHWVVYSAVHTTNIKNTALCNWWMSYLNFQIEHHMFPSMPQFRHPVRRLGPLAIAQGLRGSSLLCPRDPCLGADGRRCLEAVY
jgi:fatty acid desaturase